MRSIRIGNLGLDQTDQTSSDQITFASTVPAAIAPAQQASASLAVGTTDTVSFGPGGIVFNNTFGAGVTVAYENCIFAAEQTIASQWTNSVTFNLTFVGKASGQNGDLATNSWSNFPHYSYSTVVNALTNLAALEPNNTILHDAVANLPFFDPSNGAGFSLPGPYAQMLGLTNSPGIDTVTLDTSWNWSYGQDVTDTLIHEISEGAMGRVGGLGDQNHVWSMMDLFRYAASGNPDYADGRDGAASYFSYDGGLTLSSLFGLSFNNQYNVSGTHLNTGDTADLAQQDVFGFGRTGETITLSASDMQIMAALGWNPALGIYGSSQIDAIFQAVLQHEPSQSQLVSWLTQNALNGDASTVSNLVNLSETYFNVNPVIQIIFLATGITPTAAQLAGWVPYIEQNGVLTVQSQSNVLLDQMAEAFVASTNFGNVYNSGVPVNPNSAVTAHEMQVIIQASTGLAATPAQVNAWVATGLTVDQVFVDFALGDQYTAALLPSLQQYLTVVAENAAAGAAATGIVGISAQFHSAAAA